MRITLFGATGRTGRLVLAECRRRGHEVTAFVRNAAALPPAPRVTVRAGDARDAVAVQAALADADAVLVCLAMADITLPATDFSDSVRTIVQVMKTKGPDRLLEIDNPDELTAPSSRYRFREELKQRKKKHKDG